MTESQQRVRIGAEGGVEDEEDCEKCGVMQGENEEKKTEDTREWTIVRWKGEGRG